MSVAGRLSGRLAPARLFRSGGRAPWQARQMEMIALYTPDETGSCTGPRVSAADDGTGLDDQRHVRRWVGDGHAESS